MYKLNVDGFASVKQLRSVCSIALYLTVCSLVFFSVSFFGMSVAHAADNAPIFYSAVEKRDLGFEIAQQLRCPSSPNQSLFDSNAAIANELKGHIFRLLEEGQSKQQIIDYLAARYGEQIKFQPSLNGQTALLWFLPICLLLLAAFGGWYWLRQGHFTHD